jgi:hypothetical protein
MSTRNLPGGKGRPARKADNLTAICEPISSKYGSLDVSQSYVPPWSVAAIALLSFYLYLILVKQTQCFGTWLCLRKYADVLNEIIFTHLTLAYRIYRLLNLATPLAIQKYRILINFAKRFGNKLPNTN